MDVQGIAIGLGIAIVGGGLPTIWATRRWGTRRGHVRIQVSKTSLLLLSGAFKSEIEVRANGRTLAEPTLYTIAISNVGPRGLASEHFDGGKPITAQVPGRVVAARWMSRGTSPTITGGDEHSAVSWNPDLLPQKQTWTLHVLVDLHEERIMEFRTPLIDFDVSYASSSAIPGPAGPHE